jgi:hypothetical protein
MSDRNTTRVGYEILLEVGIDKTTGEVADVTVYPEDFWCVGPLHVYDDEDDYLDEADPRFEAAVEKAQTVIVRGDLPVPFKVVKREAADAS